MKGFRKLSYPESVPQDAQQMALVNRLRGIARAQRLQELPPVDPDRVRRQVHLGGHLRVRQTLREIAKDLQLPLGQAKVTAEHMSVFELRCPRQDSNPRPSR